MPKAEPSFTLPLPAASSFLAGHTQQTQLFLQALKQDRLHHSWMFAGKRGIGKATCAYHLARRLVFFPKESNVHFSPFTDHPEYELFGRMEHPSCTVLTRDEEGKDISVEQVRALQQRLHLSAAKDGFYRVVVIDSVDDLTISAANALLKLLEEPPAGVLFFLICHNLNSALTTIRSRSTVVTFFPLIDNDAQEILNHYGKTLSAEEKQSLLRLSEGAPGTALMLAAHNVLTIYRDMLGLLAAYRDQGFHIFADKYAKTLNYEIWNLLHYLLYRLIGQALQLQAQSIIQTSGEKEHEVATMLAAKHSTETLYHMREVLQSVFRDTEHLHLDKKTALFRLCRMFQG